MTCRHHIYHGRTSIIILFNLVHLIVITQCSTQCSTQYGMFVCILDRCYYRKALQTTTVTI